MSSDIYFHYLDSRTYGIFMLLSDVMIGCLDVLLACTSWTVTVIIFTVGKGISHTAHNLVDELHSKVRHLRNAILISEYNRYVVDLARYYPSISGATQKGLGKYFSLIEKKYTIATKPIKMKSKCIVLGDIFYCVIPLVSGLLFTTPVILSKPRQVSMPYYT